MNNQNNLFYEGSTSKSQRIIYTPSAFARSSLLFLQETGTLQAIKPHVSSRDNLNSYLFFTVLCGNGEVRYQGVEYELKEGDSVFLDCRKGYEQSSSENLWSLKWVHFYGSNMAAVYNKWCERGGKCVFHPKDPTVFISLLVSIYNAAESDSYTRDMELNLHLTELLTVLMEQTVYHDKRKEHRVVETYATLETGNINITEIKSYIDTHYKAALTLESLASRFYLSKHYLARCFKDHFGITVNGYIQLVRVGKAKELLRFSDCTMEVCALECGYDDPNYFSRVFRKVEGCNPSEYRQNWRGEKELQ